MDQGSGDLPFRACPEARYVAHSRIAAGTAAVAVVLLVSGLRLRRS
jgi:hypothetical protein